MYRVSVVVGWWLVRAFWATCRIHRVIGLDAARAAVFASKSVIPVYWHQHLLYGGRALLDLRADGLKLGFLISPSVDGTAPAMLVEKSRRPRDPRFVDAARARGRCATTTRRSSSSRSRRRSRRMVRAGRCTNSSRAP